MRMSCDNYACFHGRWNDVDGDTATGGFARPFLCETHGPKYTMVDQPMTWPAAQAYCRANFDDLAAIHSDRDHEDALNTCEARSGANPVRTPAIYCCCCCCCCSDPRVVSLTDCLRLQCVDRFEDADSCAGSQGCWIGLREPMGAGQYSWSDGTHLDYSNWYVLQSVIRTTT